MLSQLKNIKLEEIMVSPVICAGVTTRISDIAEKLYKNKITGVPIINEDKQVIGVVSERDICELILQGKELQYVQAEEVMARNVITADKNSFVIAAIKSIVENQIMRLPVVDDGKLIGIVTRHDLLKVITNKSPDFYSIS